MSLLAKTAVLGAHAYFVRNGTDDSGTAVGASHKPASDFAGWEELGYVLDHAIKNKVDDLKIMAPASGGFAYVPRETLPLSQEVMVELKLGQLNQLSLEALMLVPGALVVGTAQQPGKQSARITGWLKLTQGGHDNTERLNSYLYCELTVTELKGAPKEHSHSLNVIVLDNASNTFKIVSLT